MTAGIDGYLRWNGNKIDVVDLYVVNGDVDFNTGNVRYHGSIEVRGSVRAGFEVMAGRELTIVGMVDGGTAVSEGGGVTVGQGVIGNSEAKGIVLALGDIKIGRARFAKIESKAGSIVANYAVEHSELKATGDLTLNAGPAISCVVDVGGEVRVANVSESADERPQHHAAANPSQRREFVRVQLLPPLDVDVKRQNPRVTIQAKLVDISAGGCRIRSQVRFKPGEEFQLQFRLPDVEGMVWMDAIVVRAVDSPADRLDSRITYAIKYGDVETSVRETIAKFCQSEDFRQNRLLRDAGRTPEDRRGHRAPNRPTPVNSGSMQRPSARRKVTRDPAWSLMGVFTLVLLGAGVATYRTLSFVSKVSTASVGDNVKSVVTDVARNIPVVPTPAPASPERVNVLLLGYGGGTHDGTYLTDSIMVLSFDPKTKKAAMISVPRDIWTRIPADGQRGSFWKINTAYTIGVDDQSFPNKAA